MQQPVQVDDALQRCPNIHGDGPLPGGYSNAAPADNALPQLRPAWSDTTLVTPNDTQELKWTADELIARATFVQRQLDEMEAELGLAALAPEDRRTTFAAFQKKAKKFCATFGGVRGLPEFSKLRYFRCAASGQPCV